MDERLREKLREGGEELTDNHDSAVIADVIGEVERLDSHNSDLTAEVLRELVGK